MTVKELIEHLKTFDPNAVVILSHDPEGNRFGLLADFSTGRYYEESNHEVVTGLDEFTPELRKLGYSEEDVIEGDKCVILWPNR